MECEFSKLTHSVSVTGHVPTGGVSGIPYMPVKSPVPPQSDRVEITQLNSAAQVLGRTPRKVMRAACVNFIANNKVFFLIFDSK